MTLRLPTIQKGQAPQKVSVNPYTVLQAGEQRAAVYGRISSAIQKGIDLYNKRENDRLYRQAVIQAHEDDVDFITTWTADDYARTEVDDPLFLKLTENEKEPRIPSYKVLPEWRKEHRLKNINRLAETITDKDLRERFIQQQTMAVYSDYADDKLNAVKQQKRYDLSQTLSKSEKALKEKNYGLAKYIVKTANIPDKAKQEAIDKITAEQQDNFLNEVLQQQDKDTMESVLDRMLKNDPALTSHIPERTQTQYIRALRGKIAAEKRAVDSVLRTQNKLRVVKAERLQKALWDNDPVNIAEATKIAEAIKSSNPVEAESLSLAIRYHSNVNNFKFENLATQQNILKELEQTKPENAKGDFNFLLDKLQEAHKQAVKELSTNAIAYADKIGFIHAVPIDFHTPGTLAQGLKQRLEDVKKVYGQFNVFNGMFVGNEEAMFKDMLDNAPDKLPIYRAINEALGEYAPPFYEQMYKQHGDLSGYIAGQIYAQGTKFKQQAQFEITARDILKGAKLRKEDPQIQKFLKDKDNISAYYDKINTYFPTMFGGNATYSKAMKEALLDLYAVHHDIDKAFIQLVGKPIDYNGSYVLPPTPDTTKHDFVMHMIDLPNKFWQDEAKQIVGFSGKRLGQAVVTGRVKLIGAGRGRYYLQTTLPDGSIGRLKTTQGLDYIFTYDPDTLKKYLREKWIKKQKIKAQAAKQYIKARKRDELSPYYRLTQEFLEILD